MIRTLCESPEVGSGTCTVVDKPVDPGVLVHRADGSTGTMLFLHNLSAEPATLDLGDLAGEADHPNQVFGNRQHEEPLNLSTLELDGYGYRWIRLHRAP
jgi:maltose alpha-D-glucosyltransferase/alpha-amylase